MRVVVVLAGLLVAAACSSGSSGGPYTATPVPGPVGVLASACPRTGVATHATQMVDLASLTESNHVSVQLNRQDTLFIGASDCGRYRVPPARAVRPVLEQTQLATGGFPVLGAWYTAVGTGQVTVVVACSGQCRYATYRVTVSVS